LCTSRGGIPGRRRRAIAARPNSSWTHLKGTDVIRRFAKWYWARRWRRWALYVGVPAFLIANIAAVEVTSHSSFCKQCHTMGPYYDSWHSSAHAKVECVKCHISPGVDNFIHAKLNGLGQVVEDVLNRSGTKPSASVNQLSCIRSGCHSIPTLTNRTTDNGKFKFDHGKHIGVEYAGIKMECGTCHAHIKGDEHFEINTAACITCHLTMAAPAPEARAARLPETTPSGRRRPGMQTAQPIIMIAREPVAGAAPDSHRQNGLNLPPNTCITCHNPPAGVFEYNGLSVDHAEYLAYGASCESCHRGVTATPDKIDDGKCLSCHVFGVERSLPAVEMHKIHSEGHHKVECFSCHGVTVHGPVAQALTLEQFDCRSCHSEQHRVQRETYLFNGATTHGEPLRANGSAVSPMFMAHVDCTGCHIEQHAVKGRPGSGATVARPTAKACDRCHAPGLGEKMIPMWQKNARDLHARVWAELDAAGAPASPEAAEHLRVARDLLELVRADGSWGVHNPLYTQQLIERAREKIRQAREGSAPGLEGDSGGAPAGDGS
jgi:nitrate/TMAO reductase-like tetraheme cytochrome c subunit